MRTEVKIAFLIVPVVVLVCIIFFVNQNRKTATPVSEVVDFSAPTATTPGSGPRTPATADRSGRTARNAPASPRTTPATVGEQPARPRPEAARRDDNATSPTRGTSPTPGPGADTAQRPAQPSTEADQINERIRQLAGLTGTATREPAPTPAPTPVPTSQPSRGSPDGASPRSPISDPVTTRPATPPADRQAPAVAPPKPETTAPTGTSSTSALPGHRPTTPGARKHAIAEGETLWEIAEEYYGNGALYRRIVDANPGLDAGRLLVGNEITIPAQEGAAAPTGATPASSTPAAPKPTATTPPGPKPAETATVRKHTYVVEHGDSLIDIARNVLKDGNRWREIYELNKSKIANPDVLKVGQELTLPEK